MRKNTSTILSFYVIITFVCLVIIQILLVSCKGNEKETGQIFPISENLSVDQYPGIEPNYDYLIDYIDSVLIVVNFKGANCITLYNRFSLAPILKGVTFGKGPNEVLTPTFLFTNKKKRQFSILDSSGKKFLVFSLDSVLESSRFLSLKSIPLPSNGGFNFPVFPVNDNSYIAINRKQNGHFLSFDNRGEILGESGSFPIEKLPENIPDGMAGELYEGRYEINEPRNKIFKACLNLNQISIFDVVGNELASVRTGSSDYKSVKFENGRLKIEERKLCYVSTYLGGKYFYALYHGGLAQSSPEVLGNEIHVFDHDGDIVKRLVLKVPTSDLAVDEENEIIYGINYTSDNPIIIYK